MAKTEEQPTCQRRHARRRTLFGGLIFAPDGTQHECSISDISKSGARVRVSGELEVGSHVDLKINKYGILLRSTVMWLREGYYGVEFKTGLDTEDEGVRRFFDLIRG